MTPSLSMKGNPVAVLNRVKTASTPSSVFVTFLFSRGHRLFQGLVILTVGLGFALKAEADAAPVVNAVQVVNVVPVVTVSAPIAPGVFHMVVNALPDSGIPP